MKTTDTILLILQRSRATTSVIARELHQGTPVVEAYCQDAAAAGHIDSTIIGSTIPCWHITQAGSDHLAALLDAKQQASLTR